MSKPYRIAIAGLGTVGAGVIKILQQHDELIAARAGMPIEIVAVSARDKSKDRGVETSSYQWVEDASLLADIEGLDAVVELIGGEQGLAKELAEKTLGKGIALVTANKALLAHHGFEFASMAEKNGAPLMYEAAVAGGIPIIKSLKEGYAANDIKAVYGILNGTCNYILSEMTDTGRAFSDVLKEAQNKGYAEADPSFDVGGVDAAHKLCLLSALAFGVKPDFEKLTITGIEAIDADDISYAEELGYKIKLLGISKRLNGKIIQMVEPCLVPSASTIGAVEGVFNAVYVEGDHVGTGLEVGRGAGEGPTASAVVSDLIDLARGYNVPAFSLKASDLKQAHWGDSSDVSSQFYMNIRVLDKPGILADITAILRDHNVSMESVLQRSRDPEKPVSVAMTTHHALQSDINNVLDEITKLDLVESRPSVLRIETFTN